MADIRQKLSVDYLKKKRPAQERGAKGEERGADTEDFLGSAVMLYGGRILRSLSETPDGTDRIYGIVEKTEIPISDVLHVVEYLRKDEMVKIVEQDKLGNHGISITERGRDFAAS